MSFAGLTYAEGYPYEYCKTIKLTIGSKTAYVNGKPVVMNTISPPYMNSGRFIIPLRFVSECLNASVTWDGFMKGRTDVQTQDGMIVEYKAGDKRYYVGDLNNRIDTHANAGWKMYLMDPAPVQKKDDRMYVPVRFYADAIGASLSYDPKTRSVVIKRIDTKGWKEYTEIYSGAKIKYPYDWNIESEAFTLDIYKNGTDFKFTYEDKTPLEVLSFSKDQLLNQGWKIYRETATYMTFTKKYYNKQLTKIISTRKLIGGCLVYTVNTSSDASEWNLMIIDKMTPGKGI